MTQKEMIERLEAVALWVSEIADGLPFHSAAEAMATGVESDVDAVLAALRDRPAPPDALVANLNVRHDEALHTAIGWMSQEENLVTTREALIELLMMLKPVIFAAPAPVAAPAPETPAVSDVFKCIGCPFQGPVPNATPDTWTCPFCGRYYEMQTAPETPAPDAMPEASWPDGNNAVRWKPYDVVGHTTVRDADGSLRHEPLTREVADALWKTAEEARLRRVASMPDERAAIAVLFSAWLRLKELGWKEAEYCPKDGTPFDAIEPGSTGVHRCHYDGKWPDGRWWTSDEHDMYPSRPILWRRQEAQP